MLSFEASTCKLPYKTVIFAKLGEMVNMMVLIVTVVMYSSKTFKKRSSCHPLIPSKDSKKQTKFHLTPPTHFVRVNNNSS